MTVAPLVVRLRDSSIILPSTRRSREMMELFRNLTTSGATVILSTHVTQNLGVCDKVAWMAKGGRLVFFGSPTEALRHFGVRNFGGIYDLLEEERPGELAGDVPDVCGVPIARCRASAPARAGGHH